ncbi:NADH-quinone oxidoreductase subunit L [Lihuaxuella thermophila]|uniref:NADH-quinone oxidoreductase subunit L n=1 Tax=Lihuaxuella thermophila TaxID=1173111 RepID=A0A1H8B9C1_9BACL|nr:NADH-quinone oxidoreductase subunit L [Lihuaxuella thermophila]SEM79520.1 NADH-quinone oxidoreductase subunit L [Lihuaxuella thermophila]
MNVLWIPLFPLIAFLLLTAGRKVWSKGISALIGIIATAFSFLLSLPVLWESLAGGKTIVWKIPWFHINQQVIQFGIEAGPLNVLMLTIVSGVSFLVHLYSWGYMRKDQRINTFYAYLTLFTFSMLGLVISSNLLEIYIFWELVGVCSFLLVGFWYFKPEAKAAAKKAFIVTRIGDIGLFIAVSLLFWQVGSFELSDLKAAVANGQIEPAMITWIAILVFIGAVGKSGQFPLHTWLPDAMEGPTPVSALIHAATMVAAGVFLVANLFFLFEASETAMSVVAYTGGFTAIFAASIGLAQNDIKRVLAYSTVSQIGYMMLALGSAGYVAGVFHLMTHAFFKALLFLAAGAVIVSLHHEQDIRKMGGLWKQHRWLGIWFLTGCLAIAGIPPFSGFFSKDEILMSVYADGRQGLFSVAVIAAFFTAFYMFRLFFMVFSGSYRGEQKIEGIPRVMMIPIIVLAVLSTVAGFANTPGRLLEHWLVTGSGVASDSLHHAPGWIPVLAIAVSLLGIGLAYVMYGRKRLAPEAVVKAVPWVYQLVYRKYYIDELYQMIIVLPLKAFGWFLHGWDRFIVGGLVHLSAWFVSFLGSVGSRIQNGQAQTYALVSLIGLILLIVGLTAGRLFE